MREALADSALCLKHTFLSGLAYGVPAVLCLAALPHPWNLGAACLLLGMLARRWATLFHQYWEDGKIIERLLQTEGGAQAYAAVFDGR